MDITSKDYMDKIKPVELSDLNKTSSVYIARIDTNETLQGSIFKNIKVSNNVPFISFNDFSKVYTGFKPPSINWLNKSNNIILYYNKTIFKTLPNDYTYDESYDSYYGMAKIEFFKSYGMVISFQHEVYKTHMSHMEIINMLQDSLGVLFNNVAEKDISSMFDIPKQKLDKYIFLDMITNDDLFEKYLSVDESLQTKKSYLTVKFYPNSGKSFTFTITEQIDSDNYLRIKIKGFQTASKVDELRTVLAKLISYYNSNYTNIKNIYKAYDLVIEPINETKDKGVSKPVKVSSTIKGKSRICGKKQQPDIFESKEQAVSAMTDKSPNRIMKFPIILPKYFICKNPDYPYPGIRKNSDVPCCFKKPQVGVENSAYSLYMQGEKSGSVSTNTPHVLKGEKILEENQQGVLPDSLLSFFGKFLKNKNQLFMRYGSKKGPRSMLESIGKSKALVEEIYYGVPYLAKQEMYDYSIDNILEILKDQEAYLDPCLFVNLIGTVEELNIFMFNSNGMILPRFKEAYYTKRNNYKSIILYEQKILETDSTRWEIIALTEGKDVSFIFDEEITTQLKKLFYSLTAVSLNNLVIQNNIDTQIPVGWKLLGQMFDSYGKVRVIKINKQGGDIELIIQTTPLPPFNNCPEININYLEKYNTTKQLLFSEFSESFKGVKNVTNTENQISCEINESFSLSIPIESDIINTKIPVFNNSKLRSYVTNERVARYLMEYSIWLFSKYEDKKNLDKFMNEKVKVIPNYQYTNITKTFNEQTGIMKDGKLIVNSDECKTKLKFFINITNERTPELFETYKDYVEIPGYYKHITDFRKDMSLPFKKEKVLNEYRSNIFKGVNTIQYLIDEN